MVISMLSIFRNSLVLAALAASSVSAQLSCVSEDLSDIQLGGKLCYGPTCFGSNEFLALKVGKVDKY